MILTKIWRITNKGHWPEFDKDVEGNNIIEALANFDLKQKETGSVANHTQVISAQLIGDTDK